MVDGTLCAQFSLIDNLTPTPHPLCISIQRGKLELDISHYWMCSIISVEDTFEPPGSTVKVINGYKYVVGSGNNTGTLTTGHSLKADAGAPDGIHIVLTTLDEYKQEGCVQLAQHYPLVIPIMHPKHLHILPYLPLRMVDLRNISTFTLTFDNKYNWIDLDKTLIQHLKVIGVWMLPLAFLPKRSEFYVSFVSDSDPESPESPESPYPLWEPSEIQIEDYKLSKLNLRHVVPNFVHNHTMLHFDGEQNQIGQYPVIRKNIKSSAYFSIQYIYPIAIYSHSWI